jgi:hypothetical protein
MGEEVVAVALEIVADEGGVIAVGDEADALCQEGIVKLDFFKPDWSGLAGDLGEACQFVDQVALAHAAQREGEFGAERQAMHDRGERESDERGGERPAENNDKGVLTDEHVQVAAHHNDQTDHADACDQT